MLSTIVYADYYRGKSADVRRRESDHKMTLGEQLREVRGIRDMTLKAVAEAADISTAYLQKLERDEVKTPSPHILYRLGEVLRVPYPQLMALAGYVVPSTNEDRKQEPQNLLAHALSSQDLSDDEQRELARYLAWYRHQRVKERQ
jgi:transcriptional regulator with XRE-family HTH domain